MNLGAWQRASIPSMVAIFKISIIFPTFWGEKRARGRGEAGPRPDLRICLEYGLGLIGKQPRTD